MSVSKNPDFWRSQEVGVSKPAQPSASSAETPLNDSTRLQSSSGSDANTRSNNPSLTDGGQKAQASARRGNTSSGYDGRLVEMTPSDPGAKTGRRSASGAPSNSSVPGSTTSGQRTSPQNRNSGTAAGAGRGTIAGKNSGSSVTPSASSGIADRLRTAPKKSGTSNNSSSKGGEPSKVLSKETGKAAAGEALKQGLKGAAKGAVTGGLHGAAVGAAGGAAAGAADKINEAAARQPAGTTRGPSNRSGLLASAGESALDKGRASLQSKYGYGSGAAGKLPVTPEQAESIAKASMTLQKEVTTTVIKKVGTAVGVVVALVFALVMTMISAVSGPIAAATSVYKAQSVSCSDSSSSSSSSPSPSPTPSPSTSAASAVSVGGNSGFNLASNVSILSQVPATADLSDLNTNPSKYGLASDPDTRAKQIANAKIIIGVAKNIGFNQPGALIGIMTAMTESSLINVDHGDGAINSDGTVATSLGLFQQQYGLGWGSKEDVMNPAYAAQAFFLGVNGMGNPGLDSVAGWQTMQPGEAAQKVQHSQPNHYQGAFGTATALTNALYDSSDPVPAVTSGKINPPKAGVNVQTSANGCNASSSGSSGGGPATAAGDTYPARNESYCHSDACYAEQAADRVASGYRGECVDWAGWKLIEDTGTYGSYIPIVMGDAKDWGAAASAHGIAVDMNPRPGDAVFWAAGQGGSGSSGHIATVSAVLGNSVVIEEYNFATVIGGGDSPATGGGRYHTRTILANTASGYIHFIDTSKSKDENKQYLIDKGILVPGHTNWPRR